MHLAYIGNGTYAQLVLRTVTVQYEISGVLDPYEIQEVDTKPQVIGSLTSDESETLNKLMGRGIKMMCKIQQAQPSASAGSPDELPCIKKELNETFCTRPPKEHI